MKEYKAKATEKKKYPSGKKGICINCGNERFIADKEGFCSACHRAVLLIDPSDFITYHEALDKAKQKAHTSKETIGISPIVDDKTKQNTPVLPVPDSGELPLPIINTNQSADIAEAPKSVMNLTIADVASAGIFDIINRLAAEEDYHMLCSQKCRQARMILEQL